MATDRGAPPQAGQAQPGPIERAMAGWQPAQVLIAASRLGFFNALGDKALAAGDIALACGTHPRSTRMLLNACVALGFMHKNGDVYANSAAARETLVRGKPGYMGDAIAHQGHLWEGWGHLAGAVRDNARVARSYDPEEYPHVHRDFILAMHNRAMRDAAALAATLDLSGRRRLFDAGGGPGTYAIFLVRRYPGLRAVVFDLPETIEITREIIAAFEAGDRVTTQAGNYFKDDFGQGNDVVFLSAVLHSMGPDGIEILFRRSFDSLVHGGLLAVQEGLIDEDGTSPLRAVLFSLNMLVNNGEGQSYSGRVLMEMMKAAGFVQPRVKPVPGTSGQSLVISIKP